MTNEEIVALIQAGDRSKMLDLWEQNQGIVRLKAQRVYTILNMNGGASVDFDDLTQTCYFGFENAVASYKPEKGFAFTTYLGKALNSILWKSIGLTHEVLSDALDHAISLNTPLGDDPDGDTLQDMIEDQDNGIDRLFDTLDNQRLREVVDEILSGIERERAAVIKLHFFYELPDEKISKRTGLPVNTVKKWLSAAALRREFKSINSAKYRDVVERFLDSRTDFYHKGSVRQQSSPIETLIVRREEQRERFERLLGLDE